MKLSGRALHWVFKVGDRSKTIDFYRNVLGMKVSHKTLIIVQPLSWLNNVI